MRTVGLVVASMGLGALVLVAAQRLPSWWRGRDARTVAGGWLRLARGARREEVRYARRAGHKPPRWWNSDVWRWRE